MSKSNAPVPMFDAPRRAFVVYDNSDTVYDGSLEPSMTVQSEKANCDINNIVRRAEQDGFVNWTNNASPQWGVDVSGVEDYKSAVDFVKAADEQFMQLPAEVRARFHNDPQEFLAFVDNPENLEEGQKLGLWTLLSPEATPLAEPLEKTPKGASVPADAGAQGLGA